MFVTLWAAPDLPRLLAWPQWTAQRTPRPHPRPRSSCWPGSSRRATRDQWVALVDGVLRKSGRDRRRRGAGRRGRQARAPHPGRHPGRPLYTPPTSPTCRRSGVPGRPPYVRGGHDRRAGRRRLGRAAAARRARPGRARGRPRRPGERRHLDLAGRRATAPRAGLPRAGRRAARPRPGRAGHAAAADTGAAAAYLATWRAGSPTRPRCSAPSGSTRSGCGPAPASGPDVASVVPLAQRVAAEHPLVRAIVVDGLPVHDAGGVRRPGAGLRDRGGRGLPAGARPTPGSTSTTAARLLEFRYAATAEQFPTIAKLRAARRLWARVLEACGARRRERPAPARRRLADDDDPPRPVREPAARHVAGFAAGVGGADAVTVAPFDAALGRADAVLPADRPQHPVAADRGGAPGAGDRPGRRLLVRRVAHRRARPRRLGLLPGDRGGGRRRGGARLRAASRSASRPCGRAGRRRRHPPHADDRGQRVPRPRREARSTRAPPPAPGSTAACPSTGPPSRSRPAGPLRRRARRDRRAPAGVPRHARPARRHSTRAGVRPQPAAGRRHRRRRGRPDRDRRRRSRPPSSRRRHAGRVLCSTDALYAERGGGDRGGPAGGRCAARPARRAGRRCPASTGTSTAGLRRARRDRRACYVGLEASA